MMSGKRRSKGMIAAEGRGRTRIRNPLHHIRRQSARLLRSILEGDAGRRAVASIKSLVYQPSVRNKKATMALVCQTLKYLPILKEVLAVTHLLNNRIKEVVPSGAAEKLVLSQKTSLRSALARIMVKRKASKVEDLLSEDKCVSADSSAIRYVRVNTLKIDVNEALEELRQSFQVEQDDLIPELLAVPMAMEMYKHPLLLNGALILQGKASCMPANALAPDPDWEVLDACAAPGNKTVQLAALMKGRGNILACEINKKRLNRLLETVKLAGASNVKVFLQDFLKLDPNAPSFSKIRAILLDPSCSGSGTALQRLDHLLPSSTTGQKIDAIEMKRLEALAQFQQKALQHALSFPGVERVVYSTCSIHQRENEDVVQFVLSYASGLGFQLATPFPSWPQRGLPIFEGAHHLLRTEPSKDLEGFFIALFVRRSLQDPQMTKLNESYSRTTNREVRSKNHASQSNLDDIKNNKMSIQQPV
eukprot:c27647_g1_i3 orf=179-1606(+)